MDILISETSNKSRSKKSKKDKKKKSKKRQREEVATHHDDLPIEMENRDEEDTVTSNHIQGIYTSEYLNSFSNNDGDNNTNNPNNNNSNNNIINNNDNSNNIVNTSSTTSTSSQSGGYKTGKYTKEEDEILWNAIREYVNEKGWTQEEGLNILLSPLKTKDKRLRNAWTQIAAALPDRKRTSVFDHARRRFSSVNYQGRWTKEEEAKLRELYQAHGSDWVEIGLKLNKLPQSCRDKWRQIKNENRNTGTWSEEETSNLCEIIKSMHGGQLPEYGTKIRWSEVSQKMQTRSWYQCQVKWNLLNGNKKKFKSGV